MINCAIYPRKSKQVDNSDSMDAQVDMCIRYLNDKYGKDNYDVTIYDGDYGITGHSIKQRKDFQRMMADVSSGKIQLVLIQRYDRIARNTRDFCNLYHDMEINGCNLVSVSQQIDTTTPYGRNFMYMQASMAELEWALSSERRKDANKYARSIGKCTLANHSIPYGYKAEVIDGIRRMVKDPAKEEIVNDLFDYYNKYRNYTATARYINGKHSETLDMRRVRNIIQSPFYYGTYDRNQNFCEPYLTKEQWDKLQDKRTVIKFDENKRTEILFGGMIRCPECNRLMRSCQKKHKNQRRYRYFHCEYSAQGLCGYKRVKSELLIEEMLINRIDNYLKDADAFGKENESKNKKIIDNTKKYEQELDRLNTMFLKGRISEEKYDTEYLRLNDLMSQNKALTQAQGHCKPLQTVFVGNWKEIYNDLDKLHKKLFWREVVKQIIVDENMNVTEVIFN